MKNIYTTILLVLTASCAISQTVASAKMTSSKTTTMNSSPHHKAEKGVSYTYYDAKSDMNDVPTNYKGEVIAVSSKGKDTLYLIDDNLGHLIAQVWDTDPKPQIYPKKPVIIFVKQFPVKQSAKQKSPKVKG